MKTLLEGTYCILGMLLFCSLLAWAESVPLPDIEPLLAGAADILELIAP